MRIQKLRIGRESLPLLVIDDLVADPEELVQDAIAKRYAPPHSYYPGVRAKAPLSYQRFVVSELREVINDFFELENPSLQFNMCHYSVVTTPPAQLTPIQRVPHVDAHDPRGLASIHYLFKADLGGTAFYRHRATGFEYVDEARRTSYYPVLEREMAGPSAPGPDYIDADTPLFERIGIQAGVFNRMLVYRRNCLHSGVPRPGVRLTSDPASGRLSINSFLA
ncbi:MAG TPA: DUF6445 family protein [Povalibacter sp.]|nr:DUF6445 family protein [Povalibacter sp.]